MNKLRDIGTEFKESFYDFASTMGAVSVVTWRVTGYALCDNFGVVEYLETVKHVDTKLFYPKRETMNTYSLLKQKQALYGKA